MAIAAGAGLLVGRFARGVAGAAADDSHGGASTQRTSTPERDESSSVGPETPAPRYPDSGLGSSPEVSTGGVGGIGGIPGLDLDPSRKAGPGRGSLDS
ncbi:hypothetical protein E9229_003881 [Paeniglutamicibacter cryotolerans]|uniref:Uncharacterized protein n=1 Tax=Paeniglutamicibacter cryotolerans TaxID=670079 RepID=A0A839QMY1_9MICC|nr:hypothetical protein [Paeniglutamicibacter cryotolerans]